MQVIEALRTQRRAIPLARGPRAALALAVAQRFAKGAFLLLLFFGEAKKHP